MKQIFPFCWFLLIASTAFAHTGAPFTVPDSLNQSDRIQGITLLPYLEVMEASDSSYSIEQVIKKQHLFKPLQEVVQDPGKSYWFRLNIEGSSWQATAYYLYFWHVRVDVYEPLNNGNYVIKKTGPFLSPSERPLIYDLFSFIPITIPAEPITFYLNTHPTAFQNTLKNLGLFASKPIEDMIEMRTTKNIIFASIGICMLGYNFFLFLFNRERIYIYYLFVVFFLTAFLTSTHFFAYFFSIASFPRWMVITLNLASLFLMLFVDRYLKLGTENKRTHRLLISIAAGSGLLIIPYCWLLIFPGSQLIWDALSIGWTMVAVSAILVVSVDALKKGFQPAKYFIIANAIFVVTSFIALIIELLGAKLGLVNYNVFTTRELVFSLGGVGMLSQVILYGISIGYKMLMLNKEKAKAVEEKLKTQQTINQQLEERVANRTAELADRNRENELLLGEIHHRVKNNLQVISSLLKLQSRQLEEGKAKNAVLEGRDRVKAMALIHQRLYQQDQFSSIEMDDYIKRLVESLADSYGFSDKDYQLKLKIAAIKLNVDSAIPIGLIINELVSNVFKHAFKGETHNHLEVALEERNDILKLGVADNGGGIPSSVTLADSPSFGIQLIYALAKELKGSVSFENGIGTRVNISISDYSKLEAP